MREPQQQTPRSGAGVSRRAFLKGSGAAAAATALVSGPEMAAAADEGSTAVVGPGLQTIQLHVNGAEHSVKVEPRMTLLEALRYQLRLSGCKPVSDDGSSGASTVLIDDKPVSAETTLALDCVGKKIRTAESLGGAEPDPVVKAFVHQDGMQCGFCTPGFVVAVRAFLDKYPNATEQEIRAGLNGNLCRCGTYANVLMAATQVAQGGAS